MYAAAWVRFSFSWWNWSYFFFLPFRFPSFCGSLPLSLGRSYSAEAFLSNPLTPPRWRFFLVSLDATPLEGWCYVYACG